MGLQSSRIIWGKNKSPGGNEPDPVGLYNGDNYIYCSGNYAIHSDGSGRVAEDYHLYLCTATETGGTWVSEDWKLINGVKNYYLQAYRVFKKGARVIKEDHNGEWETLKLYVCVVNQTTPNQWVSSEWDVVYQDVGIAWIPKDHKDVYYDSGSNRNKWHKMMYFIPDYYDGQKTDEEIAVFNENQTYHFGERAIHTTLIGETYCYTYDSNIPRRAEWAAGWWSKDENVGMYETYKTYYKGDEVIKKNVEAGYQDIQEYQDEMYFEQGKYTLSIIDREHDVTALAGFHDILYIERIYAGESLYGVYKSNKTTSGSFNWQDWDLQTSEVIQTRGRDHNMVPIHTEENTGMTCRYCGKFITGYKQKDIKEYNYESGYEEGELVIWTFNDEDSVFGLLECQQAIPAITGPGEYNQATMPPNSEYWTPISQFVEQANTLRVFKATKAMDASINTHFIRENWAIVSQKMEPDYDLYGVIWEKYGKPGGGGGIPFGFPIVISGYLLNTMKANLDILYPFLGNSCLEIEKGFESSDWTYPCSSGQSFLSNIVYTLSSNSDTIKRYMVYSLTGFRTLSLDDFSLIRSSTFFNEGLIYFDQIGNRDDDAPPSSNNYYPYGKLYRSYFGTNNIFGKTQIIDIPKFYNHSGYCVFLPYNYSHSWNDPDDVYMYLYSQDGLTLLVNTAPEGMLMNVPTSLSAFTQSTWGNCWSDTEIIKRTLCYVTDSGTIVPIEYFTDYCGCDVTYTNGIETADYPDTGTNYDLFSGKMNSKYYYDIFPSPDISTGLDVICDAVESPWFDEDWASFPFAELRECYVGQYISDYQHKPADSDVLNHMRLFCNQFGLEYYYNEESQGASAIGHSYCLNIQHNHIVSGSSIQKIGYVYRDRYGGVYIFCHKIMRVSYYDYEENRYRFLESHKWGKVDGTTLSDMYSYISHYYEYAPDIDKRIGQLLIAGRCNDDLIAATVISAGVVAKYKIDLKTGSMTAYDFPLYYDLPYVGNENFSVNGRQYRKVRVYVGLYWPTYVYNIPEADNDTYVLPVVPSFNTYWTPYIANIGGVAHTGDWATVISSGTFQSSDTYWVVYVPQPLTNKFGIGGFVFASSNSNSDYRVSPSYGGPGNNGFINK